LGSSVLLVSLAEADDSDLETIDVTIDDIDNATDLRTVYIHNTFMWSAQTEGDLREFA
jgi:hypothetical protein